MVLIAQADDCFFPRWVPMRLFRASHSGVALTVL